MNVSDTRATTTLRWIGATGIAAIAVMRAMTAFATEIYFDVDPMQQFAPLAALSPAGTLTLDMLLLLACAMALTGESLSGRVIEKKLLVLALVPGAIVLWHGWHDLGDLWRGSTWLAGAVALVTVAHLARENIMRLVLLCVLIAVIGPLLVRGIGQVSFEHTATIAEFEQQREQFLAQRGWEPDSPAAQIYERRLRHPQPTGWFTTTNIFGSVMAAGVIVLAGLLTSGLRRPGRAPVAWIALAALFILATLAGLYYTGSKGAILIGVGGLGLLMVFAMKNVFRRFIPIIVIALIPLTLLGVAIRGAILPEDFLGDRSLLFRWHYFVSSWDVFRSAPLLGVGPEGFQDVYTRFRLPRNPEEVMSAHSVFIDWLCMLGMLALAWIVLVFTMIWRAGKRGTLDETPAESGETLRLVRNVAAVVAFAAFIPAIGVEWHILDELHLFMRLLGVFAFLIVAGVTALGAVRCEGRVLNITLAVAATVLLIHGQIEMTFYEPGCVVWAMCLLGVAGGATSTATHHAARRQWTTYVPAIILIALTIWISVTGAQPASQQQSRIAEAAAMLHPPGETHAERTQQRERAATWLLHAYEELPTNIVPLYSAIRQYDVAAADLHAEHRVEMLKHALAIADRAVQSHRHTKSLGERAHINWQLRIATAEEHYFDAAVRDHRRITELDPHGIQGWQILGDMLWLVGRPQDAAYAYQRALENDANFALDPLKRLPAAHRALIEQRLERHRDRLD